MLLSRISSQDKTILRLVLISHASLSRWTMRVRPLHFWMQRSWCKNNFKINWQRYPQFSFAHTIRIIVSQVSTITAKLVTRRELPWHFAGSCETRVKSIYPRFSEMFCNNSATLQNATLLSFIHNKARRRAIYNWINFKRGLRLRWTFSLDTRRRLSR